MLRHAFAPWVCLLLALAPASGQEWATKMFNTTSHDFGTVAKGAKAQFRFQIKNIYEEDVHILGVSSSCGCTTPQITRSDLKTFETSEIIADFNTRDHQGHKSAVLKVTFDKPFHAVVELQVAGFIRSDVVLQPGIVDLGTIDLGTEVEKRLQVTYAGRENWEIIDAKTADPYFQVELKQLSRGGGRVSYELLVRLTKDAPVGYIKDQLILVTNDARARELPVDVQGRVMPDITINPSKLFIGVVHPGQKVVKNLVVRGKKPFKIIDVQCSDKSFTIEPSTEAKSVHLVPVVFTAGDDPGRIVRKIGIQTDQGNNVVRAFTAFAEVVEDAEPADQSAKSSGENADEAGPDEKTDR